MLSSSDWKVWTPPNPDDGTPKKLAKSTQSPFETPSCTLFATESPESLKSLRQQLACQRKETRRAQKQLAHLEHASEQLLQQISDLEAENRVLRKLVKDSGKGVSVPSREIQDPLDCSPVRAVDSGAKSDASLELESAGQTIETLTKLLLASESRRSEMQQEIKHVSLQLERANTQIEDQKMLIDTLQERLDVGLEDIAFPFQHGLETLRHVKEITHMDLKEEISYILPHSPMAMSEIISSSSKPTESPIIRKYHSCPVLTNLGLGFPNPRRNIDVKSSISLSPVGSEMEEVDGDDLVDRRVGCRRCRAVVDTRKRDKKMYSYLQQAVILLYEMFVKE